MNVFQCPNCDNTVFFENFKCERCDTHLGFDSSSLTFKQMYRNADSANIKGESPPPRYCANQKINLCNWLVLNTEDDYCTACILNRKVPNTEDIENYEKWKRLEVAKHRLIYQLLRLKLPIIPKVESNQKGLAFDFLSENNLQGAKTGHANGVVTIILSEADSVHREQLRKQLSEPYRTLLGHFRHEIGHYYWPILISAADIYKYRNLFGDEREDYIESLQKYYDEGAPKEWQNYFISKYASAHSWEDWAETWAHYLHLMDTLETAHTMKIAIGDIFSTESRLSMIPNPYTIRSFQEIYDYSIVLTLAANSLNRSMGLPDLYPFVISESVFRKLEFVHFILLGSRESD